LRLPTGALIESIPFWLSRSLFLLHALRAAIGAGIKRTRAIKGVAPEIPLPKELIVVKLPKSIPGNMAFKNTKTRPEITTPTHQGD